MKLLTTLIFVRYLLIIVGLIALFINQTIGLILLAIALALSIISSIVAKTIQSKSPDSTI